ncbi:LacI family transcriptional regulator [Bacillaceae bacterium SIJ1]|uniref:LacI family DNA-binding transcriptional regulator n=1 Tax=Litoribacterium kuwaitense TaxID=1398745 RepID=UPI0013ECF244|nr:LacI family DNA-binding transcriptional regulator [Litoribacterium kuwaitense]NGP45241.1 LacI family transcriptional regulator [Litoribacterium kuwaitense]
MEKSNMTIRDVAKKAGVSVATISRALNNSPLIKQETKEDILKLIDDLGYTPNSLGRDLRTAKTKRILVLTPLLVWPILRDVFDGIETAARQKGYTLIACPTSSNKKKEWEQLQMLQNRLVDGVIILNSSLSKKELTDLGKTHHVVQCCEIKETDFTVSISIDEEQAAYDAVKYLLSLGHEKIGMLSSKSVNSARLRLKGYKKALADHKISFDEQLIQYGQLSYEDGVHLTERLLHIHPRPTALFCISDVLATGAAKTLQKAGFKVPEEFSIVGFDNTQEAVMASPELTTISQPTFAIGTEAFNTLYHNIHSETKKYPTIKLPHQLIERSSTAPLQ